MALINTILKEAGGRFENAAGAIDSKANMFAGSSGNALSDKLGGGENNNPIAEQEENKEEGAETTETPETTETTETDVSDTENPSSDERLKDTYSTYKTGSSTLKGKTKNLDLDPKSSKPVTSGSGGGSAGVMKIFSGMMGNNSEGAGDNADMASDAGDMGDMADGADSSDTRLKNIFGENEDAIKCFAKINAIKFVYNEKAHELAPNGEHQVDYDPHYGVKAQELAENPLTASTVEKDKNGYLCVNTEELTMANSAVISEICKRLEIIEKVLGIKVVKE